MPYFLIVLVLLVSGCTSHKPTATPAHVELRQVKGQYDFYINDKLFEIKGAGLSSNFSSAYTELKKAGGNSFRTWSTRNGKQVLDSAAKYGLMVALGLEIGKELHGFDYENNEAVEAQLKRLKAEVDQYKDHPNLLCWVAGNELNLFFDENDSLALVNPKTYVALNDLVKYIHQVDPNHPVTTTFAGANKWHIDHAVKYCPNLDFFSFQVYGDLRSIPEMVEKAGIKKPYAITEFGPIGHWERPSTVWGREIEETSTAKAQGLRQRMRSGLDGDQSGLSLGGYAFLWGQKQERTPTWYGMFVQSGEATSIVDELTKYWSGAYPENQAPKVDSMLLNQMSAEQNIYLKANIPYSSQVFTEDPDGDELTFKWVTMEEVKVRSQGGAHEKEPGELTMKLVNNEGHKIEFYAPGKVGAYRIFCYVFDGNGKVGTVNIPFYVTE